MWKVMYSENISTMYCSVCMCQRKRLMSKCRWPFSWHDYRRDCSLLYVRILKYSHILRPEIHILVVEIASKPSLKYFKRIQIFNKGDTATTSRGFDSYLGTGKYCTNARDGKAVKCDGKRKNSVVFYGPCLSI